jgi:hypothetical protein
LRVQALRVKRALAQESGGDVGGGANSKGPRRDLRYDAQAGFQVAIAASDGS